LFFVAVVGLFVAVPARMYAQAPQTKAPLEFDVVSIKRSANDTNFMESRTLPDGTLMIVNGTLPIGSASPVPVLPGNIVGLPTGREPSGTTLRPSRPPARRRRSGGR
jgi:hypothetical protein